MIVTELIEIAAVDDHAPFLQRLRQAVSQASDMTMLAVGSTADDAYRIAAEDVPDVLLLDLDIPGGGIQAAGTITRAYAHVRIIMVSGHGDDEQVVSALASGAIGYLVKDANLAELHDAIRAVHAGRPYITEELASRLVVRMFGAQAELDANAALLGGSPTSRSRQPATGVAQGLSPAGLFYSPRGCR